MILIDINQLTNRGHGLGGMIGSALSVVVVMDPLSRVRDGGGVSVILEVPKPMRSIGSVFSSIEVTPFRSI